MTRWEPKTCSQAGDRIISGAPDHDSFPDEMPVIHSPYFCQSHLSSKERHQYPDVQITLEQVAFLVTAARGCQKVRFTQPRRDKCAPLGMFCISFGNPLPAYNFSFLERPHFLSKFATLMRCRCKSVMPVIPYVAVRSSGWGDRKTAQSQLGLRRRRHRHRRRSRRRSRRRPTGWWRGSACRCRGGCATSGGRARRTARWWTPDG